MDDMTYFWAKTTSDGKPGISVYNHMLNVGYVARCIAEMSPKVLERFGLRSVEVGALAALHDLGKISPGFQRKCEVWLEENGLVKVARNGCWDTGMEPDHGKTSHSAVQDFLMGRGIARNIAMYLAAVLGAHHGRIKFHPNPRGIRPPIIRQIADSNSGIDWDNERLKCAERLWVDFNAQTSLLSPKHEVSALWWLAGLTSVADWIGSDERFFPADKRPVNLPANALQALNAIGFGQTEFVENLSFHDLFHDEAKPDVRWIPNEMQEATLAAVRRPGIYVIEAPMGMGKTEAALWAAYRMLVSGKATGIYFALPTQATSNRMHVRMNAFVRRISRTYSASRLIHGNSWLMDQKVTLLPVGTTLGSSVEDARAGQDWFSSAKRSLLAPFGVGTVDQALLGVAAAKHFFVRHFALAGKVVIIDEVHSYDVYTGRLIDTLMEALEGLGCTIIVLSATLTGKRRRQIIACSGDMADDPEQPYPLLTGQAEGETLKPVASTPPDPRVIKVDFLSEAKATEEAIRLGQNGGAVIWICNTVEAAQRQYERLTQIVRKEFPVGLLHARFPFWRREELETEWMGRFGKDGATRCGSILVSTQIVEQSVDLDADLLITELAPTDMLLQRLGRLWRHNRPNRPVDSPRICIVDEEADLEELRVMEPNTIVTALGKKAKVYAPFILLRSLEVWKDLPQEVTIPLQIRKLIESTYEDRENEPDSWLKLRSEWFGTDSAKKMFALRNTNIWQLALEDQEGMQTRTNEMPTVPMVLCRSMSKQEASFIDGTSENLGEDKFRLSLAQAIHRNLVRIPEYCFDHVELHLPFADYLHGPQCAGIVSENGGVKTNGLQKGVSLHYSDVLGLVIDEI